MPEPRRIHPEVVRFAADMSEMRAGYYERRWPRDYKLAAWMFACGLPGAIGLVHDWLVGQWSWGEMIVQGFLIAVVWISAVVLVRFGLFSKFEAQRVRADQRRIAAMARGEQPVEGARYTPRPWNRDPRWFIRTFGWAWPGDRLECQRCRAPFVGPMVSHQTAHAPDPYMSSQAPSEGMKIQPGMAVAFTVDLLNQGFGVRGGISTGALCKWCFAELRPSERLPYYTMLMDTWAPPASPSMRRIIEAAVMADK